MNTKSILLLVIFLVILVIGFILPIYYFYKVNTEITNKLELTIMSIAIISWLGLFINSIINKYMDN
jgi:hypothetical protein